MCSLRREHKDALQPHLRGVAFDIFEEIVRAPSSSIIGMHDHTRDLAGLIFRMRLEGGTGDDHPIALNYGELLDLLLEEFARPPDEMAAFLKRHDEIKETRDIGGSRASHAFEALLAYQGPHAFAREELAEEPTFDGARDEMSAPHASADSKDRRLDVAAEMRGDALSSFEERLGLANIELILALSLSVDEPLALDEADQLIGRERDGGMGRDLRRAEVEGLSCR